MQQTLHPTVIWFPLDNSAKLFPAIVSVKDSCVFRLSAELTEPVEPTALQQAVMDVRPRFPSFYVRLRRGVFWNYFEENNEIPLISEDSGHVNAYIDVVRNRRYHFKVMYFGSRISLETFHGLSDGTGSMELLKAILFRYMELINRPVTADGLVMTRDQTCTPDETVDSSLLCYGKHKQKRSKPEPAYRLQGTRFDTGDGVAVIHAHVSASAITALAKQYQATVTQLLVALYIVAILRVEADSAQSRRTVQVSIPVNLRRFFASKTLRNFTMVVYASVPCSWRDRPFEEILAQVKSCFEQELTEENLREIVSANVSIEKNWFLRICPLFIKNTAIRVGSQLLFGDRGTSSLSNVGVVRLPESMQPYIKSFDFEVPVGERDTHNVGIVTYQDHMTVTLTRAIYETELERQFAMLLTENGIDVEITGNRLEDRLREANEHGKV